MTEKSYIMCMSLKFEKKIEKASRALEAGKPLFIEKYRASADYINETFGCPLDGVARALWDRGLIKVVGEGPTHFKYGLNK